MNTQNTSAQPAPDYLATLRLQRAPFLDQADDRFFYADPVLVQRLDLLQHLTRFGGMLIGVIAPDGAGKTTLLQQFLLRGGHGWRFCRLEGARITQGTELLTGIAECLGLPPEPDVDRAKASLLRHCQGLQQGGQLTVVVIDDAQRLPEAALRALLDLGGSPGETLKALRIVMFGDDTLEQRLTDIGLQHPQQPLLHRLDIPRFDEQQSASYLMYRLAVAGYSGDCPFSVTEIRAIHKAADGRPGQLNVLAHETLMERAQRITARNRPGDASGPQPTARRPVTLLAGLGGALALAVVSAYLLMNAGRESPPPAPVDIPALSLNLPPEPLPPIDAGERTTGPVAEPPPAAGTPPRPPMTEAAPQPDLAAVAPPASADPQPRAEPAPEPTPEPPQDPAPAPPADAPPAPTQPAPPSAAVPPLPSGDTSAEQTAPPAAEAPPEAPAPTAAVSTPASEAPASAAPADVRPADATGRSGDVLREDWVLERPATHFTLQLLGVRNEAALQDYVARQKLPPPVAYFRTKYKGGDWHVLVQGDYASVEDARAAIDSLSPAVRKAKPWPRSFASIQADLKNQ